MNKRQFLVAMAVFIIVTLVAACGQTLQPQVGVTSEPAVPTAPTQKATAEPAAPTAPPVEEPTAAPEAQNPTRLVIAQGVDAESMDAMFTQARFTENTLIHIFERLVKLNNETMQWDPLLATSWKRIDDLTMEFKLREGVKFHDGEDFDADAVKYTVDRLYSSESDAA
jgi:ABC-type transport system substrate-binding protein